MKFSEIANRLTGISSPILGVSWQPGELEVSAARRAVAYHPLFQPPQAASGNFWLYNVTGR